MATTEDRDDSRLTHGTDENKVDQAEAYLVLSEEERAKGFVRPLRLSYLHLQCGSITSMNQRIAETYAREPSFYGSTYCVHCSRHLPVGKNGEFVWVDNGRETDVKVGT